MIFGLAKWSSEDVDRMSDDGIGLGLPDVINN